MDNDLAGRVEGLKTANVTEVRGYLGHVFLPAGNSFES